MRIEAAIFAAFCVIVFFREGAAAQQAELPGVWNTNLSIASGTGAQAWVQFSKDGSYNRLVFLPRQAEDGPSVPSGNSLIVTYTIEDYQPKQCLKTPGTPFVGCEPPPSDYQKTMQVRMVFAGPAALTQYSHDGSSFAFTRTNALPAIPRECYDAQ